MGLLWTSMWPEPSKKCGLIQLITRSFASTRASVGSGYAPSSIENVFKHGNLQTLFTALSDACTAMLGGSRGVMRKLFEHGACNYAFLWST